MAKNKSNPKSKKSSQAIDTQGKKGFLGTNMKRVGMTLAAVLIGEIVEVAIERLMQKMSERHAVDKDDANSLSRENVEPADSQANSIKSTALKLQDKIEDVSFPLKDVLEAIRVAIRKNTPNLADVVDSLREIPQRSLQQSVGTAGNTAEMAVDGLVTTLRDVLDAIDLKESDKLPKKDKKKKTP